MRGAPHLRRAIEEPIDPARRKEVLAPLATALFDIDAPAAIDAFGELAELEDDPAVRTSIEIGQVQALALTDRWSEAAALAKRCAEELPADREDERAMFEAMRSVTAHLRRRARDVPATRGVPRPAPRSGAR